MRAQWLLGRMRARSCWLSACACFLIAPAAAQPEATDVATPDARPRALFRLAYELARAGLPAGGADPEMLRGYVLYPYLEAARHTRAIAGAGGRWGEADEAARAFLERHAQEPVGFNLRTAWLRSLARRELWPRLLEHYRDDAADTALRCQRLRARIAVGELADIGGALLDEWLTPFQLPFECEPVFEWGRAEGVIDDDATEARVRLLLENGQPTFARIIAQRLPEARARPLLAWADLIERPLRALETYVALPTSEIDTAMLMDGWSRLARDNPSAALGMHELLITARGLDDGAASPYTLALALGLAWDRRPEALEYFARVAPAHMDDYALEWQTRAALWAGRWDIVRRSIAAMSAPLRDSAQWRYWAARAAEDREGRERIFESIIGNDNYYAAAAAAHLRERAEPHPEPLVPDFTTIAALTRHAAIERAAELWNVGLTVAATREWRHGSASFDAEEKAQSIHLAMVLRWYDLGVATATEAGVFNDYRLLYPRPYAAEVDAAAREFDLDPELIYAVIRQESLYRADVESSAGARGVMQLRRGTAEDIARRLGVDSRALDLLDPAVNIRLGAAELKRMLERYDGGLVPALAAYNAGPAAADRWLPDEPLAGDIWLENIPYNETRDYVRRVLWHRVVFEWLAEERGLDTRAWLDDVASP